MLLFGWDFGTWERALAWASELELKPGDMFDETKRARFMHIRRKWLNAGGPMDGPTALELNPQT